MKDIKKKLMRGAVWLAMAKWSATFISLVSVMIVARLLTPEDYGLVALAATIFALVNAFTELSMADALVHHDDPQDDHIHTAFTLNLLRGVVVSAVLLLLAAPLAMALGDPRLERIIQVLTIGIFLSGFQNPRFVFFKRNLIFHQLLIQILASALIGAIVAIAMAIVLGNYWAIVIGTLVSSFVNVVVTYVMARYRPKLSLRYWRELVGFASWLSLSNGINAINWRVDPILIGTVTGPAALGLYTMGDRLAKMPTREMTAPLKPSLFPAFSRVRDDPVRLKNSYLSAQTFISFIALPAGVGFAMIAEPLILMVMGEKWQGAVIVAQVLATVFGLQTVTKAASPLAMGLGETKQLMIRDIIMFVIRVPLIVGGVLLAGLPGAVFGRVCSGMISSVLDGLLTQKLIGLTLVQQVAANGRTLLAALALALSVVAAQDLLAWGAAGDPAPLAIIGVSVVAGAISYLATVFGVWVATGRRKGPEREIVQMAGTVLQGARRFRGGMQKESRPAS